MHTCPTLMPPDRYRAEYAQGSNALRDRRNNSNNSMASVHSAGLSGSGAGISAGGHGTAHTPTRPGTPTPPFQITPAYGGSPTPTGNGRSHRPRQQSKEQIADARFHLDPPPPQMTPEESMAWHAASSVGLRDRGCRLVWVGAFANAAAAGWTCGVGGGVSGFGDRSGLSPPSPPSAVADRVPWDYLAMGLQRHLCGTLTIPSSRDRIVDEGPYGDAGGEGGENAGAGTGNDSYGDLGGEGGGYGALDSQAPRGMNDEELLYVRGILQAKQAGRRGSTHAGGSRGSGGSWDQAFSIEDPNRNQGDGHCYERGSANSMDSSMGADVVSVEGFAQFSKWWAPLMRMLSRLRKDWATLSPIVVHGFVGRMEAERRLQGRERGTFLLRFSERKAGVLVVSFTEHVSIFRTSDGSRSVCKLLPLSILIRLII